MARSGSSQFTLFIGEVKAGAVYEMKGKPGTGADNAVGYRAAFMEVHGGSNLAMWNTNDATVPTGKVTVLTVDGKGFTFKIEGVEMAAATNANVDGKGTFTADGTGQATLP